MTKTAEVYRQAADLLLSGRPIEKAWQDCLLYLQGIMPVDFLGLHLLDLGLGIVETVIDASPAISEPVSKKTTLSPEARAVLEVGTSDEVIEPMCLIINDVSQNEFTQQVGMDLGSPNAATLILDLVENGHYLGFVSLSNDLGIAYTQEQADLLMALHRPFAETAARFNRNRELERVRDMLSEQAAFLKEELKKEVEDKIVGASFGLRDVLRLVDRVAKTDAPVLLLGETGVGKEVIAGAIHRSSPRNAGPFIKVNCGSIPSSLLESELFGHEKGAFTGAVASRPGYFERADGGTIFLDEVAELSPEAQVRLLRVLQDKKVERVGGKHTLELNLRVLAATHRDLSAMIADGSFREDLFFRLNVFPIAIPPLRQRREDIPKLAYHFLGKKAAEMALVDIPTVAPGAVDILMDYSWPGNVRELANVIEREIIICQGKPIDFSNTLALGQAGKPLGAPEDPLNLDEAMRAHITRVLHMTGGRVEGPGGAAELLGIHSRTLRSRMSKLGIPFGRKAKDIYNA